MEKLEWNCPEQWKKWDTGMGGSRTREIMKIRNGTVPNNKKMGNGNGTVQNNAKHGIREWNGTEQWKKWETEMELSRTMQNIRYGNGTVPNKGKNGIRE